ncbi:MAG: molybdopterin synthase catalytic subunit/molybdopterin converting factor small subunit [Planctomycetota bacterium]|jgi:molybdopterin synthase catalytic subunit/molybdopterin converting factor small subunit
MELRVLLFASLRERAGVDELLCSDLPDGLDLGGLKQLLQERHPELGNLEHISSVIGEQYVSDDTVLRAGQEVALLPPVSGGDADPDEALALGIFELAKDPIDGLLCQGRVEHDSCGAVITFSGNVRESNRGENVERIDYEAFERMAHPEMQRIFERCRQEFGDANGEHPERALRMLCVHRIGSVQVGECSVLIAVASPHRANAFDAARFLIDELKKSLPVWKKEVYAEGHHWIGDRS